MKIFVYILTALFAAAVMEEKDVNKVKVLAMCFLVSIVILMIL